MIKYKEIIRREIAFAVAFIMCSAIFGCSTPSLIHIDIKKGAIVSCDGMPVKEMRIESDSDEVTLEGASSITYFNQKNNVSKTTIRGKVVYDYVLKLRRNCVYRITKPGEMDRGSIHVDFKTDSVGNIKESDAIDCRD